MASPPPSSWIGCAHLTLTQPPPSPPQRVTHPHTHLVAPYPAARENASTTPLFLPFPRPILGRPSNDAPLGFCDGWRVVLICVMCGLIVPSLPLRPSQKQEPPVALGAPRLPPVDERSNRRDAFVATLPSSFPPFFFPSHPAVLGTKGAAAATAARCAASWQPCWGTRTRT